MHHLRYTPVRQHDHCMVCGTVVNTPGDCADCEQDAREQREAGEELERPHPQYAPDGKGNMVLVERERLDNSKALLEMATNKIEELKAERDSLREQVKVLSEALRETQVKLDDISGLL